MSLIISHNLSALNTQRNLNGSGSSMAKSIEKLSSGYKINVGADDPSGLIISEQLRSQISGLERAVRNSSEAFNLIGMAEGALNEMNTILKKMRALAIHAANSGVTSPEQVAADQSEMDSGIETLNRIANTTRYSDQYILNGQKQLVYDTTTVVNEPTDHSLLDTKMTRIDQVFKRDGVKMSIGFAGEKSQYQANTDTSAQRAYLEADNAHSLSEIDGANVTAKQEFILTGTAGSRLFSFAAGAHLGTIVDNINNVRDSTGIGASLTFASDVRIDKTTTGTADGSAPNYQATPPQLATPMDGFDDGTYIYRNGDVQIYGAGLNNVATSKISEFSLTPDAASSFKVGFNTDGDGKIYAKVVDKSTNSIEYYKDRECTMLIGQGDDGFFAATNNSGIPSSPVQNLDGIFLKLNTDFAQDLDVYEIAVVGQRLDNQKDMSVDLAGWSDVEHSVMSGVNLGVNTDPEGGLFYEYKPMLLEADGTTVKSFQINVYKHPSKEPKYLVATSGTVENNIKVQVPTNPRPGQKITQYAGQTVRLESVIMDDGTDSGLNITLNIPKKGALDGVSGMTIDEVKATPEYKAVMDELANAKTKYGEVVGLPEKDDYILARDDREKAIADLETATKALEQARRDEEKIRREIDRLEMRDLGQQQIDAQNDLKMAQNDILYAGRDAIYDESLDGAYRNVTKNSPGAPEIIAEQMAQAVINEITAAVGAGDDPAVDIDWADEKTRLVNSVLNGGQPPLDDIFSGLAGDELTKLENDVNSLLSAAYDAATNLDLVKEAGDAAAFIDELGVLERDRDDALKLLTDERTKFDTAVDIAMKAVEDDYTADITEANVIKLADSLRDELVTHIRGVADDQTIKFGSYDWQRSKADIVSAAIASGGTAMTNMSSKQLTAFVSDMYDSLTREPNLAPVVSYANAAQDLAANPAPKIADFSSGIASNVLGEITGTDVDWTDATGKLDLLKTWVDTAGNPTLSQLSSEISAAISSAVDAYTPKDATQLPLDTNATLIAAVKTAITTAAGTAGSALQRAYDVGGAGISVTAGDAATAMGALIDDIWANITTPRSSVTKYFDKAIANTEALAAEQAAGGDPVTHGALGSAAAGAAANTSVIEAVQDEALAWYLGADGLGTTAGLKFEANETLAAGTTGQAIADAINDELLILAREGMDVTKLDAILASANPNDVRTKNLMVDGILEAIELADPTFVASVGEATLRQFAEDSLLAYSETLAGAGEFDTYSGLVADYVELDMQLSGGAIKRAEDRLERYADRIENAPIKAKTSAATRKPWQRLVTDYPGATDADLTKLANDFGAYVRDLVEDSAAAGTQNKIVWNSSDSTTDVHDWLTNQMQNGPTHNLWDAIQAKIADPDPDVKAAGNAALADFNKVVEKMFASVTDPEYDEDVAEAAEPPPASGDYVYRSPAKKYFDQYAEVERLTEEYEDKVEERDAILSAIESYMDEVDTHDADGDGVPDGSLVADLHDKSLEFGEIAKDAEPWLEEIAKQEKAAKELLAGAEGGKTYAPKGNQAGSVVFTNLGMRVYAVDYGSAETIRIQNKSGNLFYQYREADSMEKMMIEPDTTVQIAGQDAQISLNGAPVFTTGLVANTTTPDFAGSLIFNSGTLGKATLAVTGHDVGKLYSRATALQGIEENEAEISQMRRHFEPPASTTLMGDAKLGNGMLNKNGNPVSLYMDFSQMDPSVEVKIDNLGNKCPITVKFAEPDTLTIDASLLGTETGNGMAITVKVDPENLINGYYVTDPALKGLYIKTTDLVDLNRSGGKYEPLRADMPSTTPTAGDVMLEVNTYATNPRSNTSESMDNFKGGMQFQLGNTQGDQDRTIYSIQSMAMSELGRISYNGAEYCLQNVLGGGLASLTKDPMLAMRVLEQAVDDVTTLRARLGAFQANMLQSNINSLGVAIENITKTESAIRDTDMAEESTQFTRFQIMQQAGTSMLAQANQVSQNVMTLLQ